MKATRFIYRVRELLSLQSKRTLAETGTFDKSYSGYSTSTTGEDANEQTTYSKFREDEMAVLTSNPATVPILETILRCPIDVTEWSDSTRKDKQILYDIARMYESTKLPSVTRVLQATQSPLNQIILAKWKRKMTVQMGKDGFEEYMKKISGEGSSFHQSVENFLKNLPVDIEGTGEWKSIHAVLQKVTGIHGTEFLSTHPLLSYLGKVDCVAIFDNKLCVLDWKLSSKKKETLKQCYDDPYQVAAYAGAFNASSDNSSKITNAVIVKAYRDGSPADVHYLNGAVLEFYWEGWVRRLARYHMQIFNSQSVNQKTSKWKK